MTASPLSHLVCETLDTLSLKFKISKECSFFKGHFPGHPILPAFACIHFIPHFLEVLGKERKVIASVSRAKFIQSLSPETEYVISLNERDSGGLDFTYQDLEGATLAKGRLRFADDV